MYLHGMIPLICMLIMHISNLMHIKYTADVLCLHYVYMFKGLVHSNLIFYYLLTLSNPIFHSIFCQNIHYIQCFLKSYVIAVRERPKFMS